MCIHRYIKYACGHTLAKDPLAVGPPPCTKCAFVLVALHYFHDQTLYQSSEVELSRTIRMPTACPPVFPNAMNTSTAAHAMGAVKDGELASKMQASGADSRLIANIVNRASLRDLDSHRKLTRAVQAGPLPRGFVSVFDDLAAYQHARDRECNVEYQEMNCGCGFPSSTSQACLTGWDAKDILMYRSRAWNRGPTAKTMVDDVAMEERLLINYAVNPTALPVEGIRMPVSIPLSASLKKVLGDVPPGLVMRPVSIASPAKAE